MTILQTSKRARQSISKILYLEQMRRVVRSVSRGFRMGDKKERLDTRNSQHADAGRFFFASVWGNWLKFGQPNVLTPVHASTSQMYHRPSTSSVSPWQLCKAWIRYHSIQVRWDIERGLARLLHRRWI
jgi:hypothetical protein